MLITSFISNHFILIRDVRTVGARQDYTPWMGPRYFAGHHTHLHYVLQEIGFAQAGCKLQGVKEVRPRPN